MPATRPALFAALFAARPTVHSRRLAFLAVAALGLTGCAQEEEFAHGQSSLTYEWRLVTSWPKNYPGLGTAPENFAKRVEAMSGGRLKIKVYGGGELVPPLEVFDAVRSGSVQAGHAASYYWRGKVPAAQYFTTLPFGMTAEEITSWMYFGGGLELWRETYAPFGLVPFPAGSSGQQWFGWYRDEIQTARDLEGLLVRIPGVGGEVLNELGAQQVQLAGSEIFTALQTGAIDATEWAGPYNDQASGFHQLAKNYYYPGWQEPGAVLELIINEDAWNDLPPDLQAIVENAAMAEHSHTLAEYTARNPPALRQLVDKGVNVLPVPDGLWDRLRDISARKREELSRESPQAAKVHASWQHFYDEVRWYRKHAEDHYVGRRDP